MRSFTILEVAELQPQLSANIIRIMEQRLSAIEYRSACLQNLINQVMSAHNVF